MFAYQFVVGTISNAWLTFFQYLLRIPAVLAADFVNQLLMLLGQALGIASSTPPSTGG